MRINIGIFVVPDAGDGAATVEQILAAERSGLDIVGIQDHPYQARFLDTWTLLAYAAGRTERIRLVPDVVNLPLRLPSVLAKSAASLDVLSGGRVELGIGAGAFWDGVAGLGGPRRTPGESVDALSDAIDVIRGFWEEGPQPFERIEIWLGAYKPRMLRLTGRKADGWLVSAGAAPPEALGELTAQIDAAAEEAGRDPREIRRLYNLDSSFKARDLCKLYEEHGISAFILMTDDADEIKRFAHEIAPMVRELVP